MVFLALSQALGLSQSEERTLLDVTPQELLQLHESTELCGQMDMAKLQRRADYAIPILRRMLASSLP